MEGRRTVKAPRKLATTPPKEQEKKTKEEAEQEREAEGEDEEQEEREAKADPMVQAIEAAIASYDYSLPPDEQQEVFGVILNVVQQSPGRSPTITTAIATRLTLFIKQLADNSWLSLVDNISIFVGALAEFGARPVSIIVDTWIEILRLCLSKAVYAMEKEANNDNNVDDNEEEEDEEDVGGDIDLDRFEKATAAIFSRSDVGRLKLKQNEDILLNSIKLRWKWRFLHHMAVTMDEEELVVLHPVESWGFSVKVCGVSDLFQLHVLLAVVLRDPLKGNWTELPEKHRKHVYANPQDHSRDPQYPGRGRVWSLYSWTIINSEKKIGEGLHHWLFGEGVPADIPKCPVLDNRRVLVLGPLAYTGNLPLNRDFAGMVPDVSIMQQYDATAVSEMVQKIAEVSPKDKDIAAFKNALDTNVGKGEAILKLQELGVEL